jgi:hypothetical protein
LAETSASLATPFPGLVASSRRTVADEIEVRTGHCKTVISSLGRETEMTSYRLTYDLHPKELARRDSAGTHVALLWSRSKHRASVVVEDDATGELVELDIRERENPLDIFEHPYAYLSRRGHPGRRTDLPGKPGLAAA